MGEGLVPKLICASREELCPKGKKPFIDQLSYRIPGFHKLTESSLLSNRSDSLVLDCPSQSTFKFLPWNNLTSTCMGDLCTNWEPKVSKTCQSKFLPLGCPPQPLKLTVPLRVGAAQVWWSQERRPLWRQTGSPYLCLSLYGGDSGWCGRGQSGSHCPERKGREEGERGKRERRERDLYRH